GLRWRAVWPRSAARCREILHHHPGWRRPWKIFKALRRHEDGIPEIQLRGHGRRALPPPQRRPRHKAPAADHRQFDGRHAYLDLGWKISEVYGRAGADG